MKVKINLSGRQQQRLRNGYSVRVKPKMVGSGASAIIDPMTFSNLNKNLVRNKVMLVNLSPELNKVNMQGASLMGGLKIAKKGSLTNSHQKSYEHRRATAAVSLL